MRTRREKTGRFFLSHAGDVRTRETPDIHARTRMWLAIPVSQIFYGNESQNKHKVKNHGCSRTRVGGKGGQMCQDGVRESFGAPRGVVIVISCNLGKLWFLVISSTSAV